MKQFHHATTRGGGGGGAAASSGARGVATAAVSWPSSSTSVVTSGHRASSYGGWQHAAAAEGNGGLLGTLYHTWQGGGARSLFVATEALCIRIGVGTAAQFSFYDLAKRRLVADCGAAADSSATHVAAGVVSGVMTTAVGNPIDVVYSRIANQPREPGGTRGLWYTGPIDCLRRTLRTEGLRGLYRGGGASLARVATHTTATFVLMEQVGRGLRRWSKKYEANGLAR